jgi:hypothetical protein
MYLFLILVVVIYSGGGTGSGLGSLLLERLSVDYGRKSKLSFAGELLLLVLCLANQGCWLVDG